MQISVAVFAVFNKGVIYKITFFALHIAYKPYSQIMVLLQFRHVEFFVYSLLHSCLLFTERGNNAYASLKTVFDTAVQIVNNGIYFFIVYIAAGISSDLHGNKLQDFAYRFGAYPVDAEIEQGRLVEEFI